MTEGELLQAVCIPKTSSEARWGLLNKICRKVGEFATAIGGEILIDPPRSVARIVIGATSGRPNRDSGLPRPFSRHAAPVMFWKISMKN